MAPLNVATKSEIIEALVEARGDVTVRYVSAPNHPIPTILPAQLRSESFHTCLALSFQQMAPLWNELVLLACPCSVDR